MTPEQLEDEVKNLRLRLDDAADCETHLREALRMANDDVTRLAEERDTLQQRVYDYQHDAVLNEERLSNLRSLLGIGPDALLCTSLEERLLSDTARIQALEADLATSKQSVEFLTAKRFEDARWLYDTGQRVKDVLSERDEAKAALEQLYTAIRNARVLRATVEEVAGFRVHLIESEWDRIAACK